MPAIDEAAAVREQHDELASVLDAVGAADGWSNAVARCPGWTVADVVLHVAQSDELATASIEGRFAELSAERLRNAPPAGETVDDVVEAMVAAERGRQTPDELHDRWRAAAAALDDALEAVDPHARVPWVAGELSVRTMAVTRLAENWIHAGDVADAVGATLEPGDRLRHVARLAWRTLPYAFSRAGRTLSGSVAFDLVGPTGEPWQFGLDESRATTITGPGVELCLVAARRLDPAATSLRGEGPDAAAVLELVRTYA